MKKIVPCAAGGILFVGILLAQTAVLHPEMTVAPDAGTDSKPAGTLGEKPAQTWTDTTVAAGVDKKPQPGHVVTVTGEVIDLSCYLQLGKHGEAHRSCGQKCAQNGQPVGLLAKDGTLYLLMPEEHHPRRDGAAARARR